MTKTTAEVKRWDANGPMDLEPEGSYVLATDYDTLQQRCEQLTECVRELVGEVDCTNAAHFHRRKPKVDKAKALIGGEKGVGT